MSRQMNQNRWKAFLFVGISLLVISLDNTILNVALPSIANDLGASANQLQWIVDAYVLVFAALLLTMGSLGDRLGRKRILQVGLLWFGVGSLGAALAPNTTVLIVTRAFLGVGAAMIMPATLSLITATFLDKKERAKAIALWAAVFALGTGIGPFLGGALLIPFTWHAVFLVNLPVVTVALLGGQKFIAESKDEQIKGLDVPGVLLSIAGLFALVYGIIEAGVAGWTATNVLAAFGAAAVLLGVFLWWEWRTTDAMLPLEFFRNPSFSSANLALTLLMFSLASTVFFLTQYFQSVQGYTPLEAGLRIFPLSLLLTIAAGMSSRLSGRLGVKRSVGLGLALAAIGLLGVSLLATETAAYTILFPVLATYAIGMGLAMPPATDSVMASVPVSKAGVGSAMNDTTRQLGSALGVAVLGTMLNVVYLDQVAALQDVLPANTYALVQSSIQSAQAVGGTAVAIANEAFVAGMDQALLIGAIILGLATVLTFAFLPSIPKRSQVKMAVEQRPLAMPGD